MHFFLEPLWWLLFAFSTTVLSVAALMKPIRITPLVLILLAWGVSVVVTGMTWGIPGALADALLSLVCGLLLLLLSILFSGVKLMAKKRYGGL
ncbi:MAG: hypothetical protein HGB36_10345 [Chlorobiaceae bacterium]|jgi:hypothetical protein|nr:hypothetical protein [Chlorobiaceae bacterium]